MRIGRLHVITDVKMQQHASHLELAQAAIEGGAEVVQLRDKEASALALLDTALELAALCRRKRIHLIVNDRADIAWAADAHGVHLGNQDLPLSAARRLLGPDRILGASADNAEETARLAREGADYAGIGPIFSTTSKTDAGPVLGIEGLVKAVRASPIPLIAIGGITLSNLEEVVATGVHGVALLSAVSLSPNPASVVQKARAILDFKRTP
jgi:thiamine-phosphate pyrophosphorylase